MPYVEIKKLRKYFKTPRGVLHAVDDVDLTIERGSTIGVVGESGCGKSTLGKTIVRLINPTSGEIWFDGKEIGGISQRSFKPIRTQIQMIFQDPYSSLDPRMTTSELIAEPMWIHKTVKSKAEMMKTVNSLMDMVGIAQRFANSYPHELDGGRRQRIGIARALALDPSFIICDEPVSALDVSIQAQIINLLQDLQREKNLTYMFITHDLSVVRHISDQICVMYLGQVVEQCGSKELFKKPLHPYTKALLSAVPEPKLENRRTRIILKGEITSPVDPKPCCRFAARCRYATEQCFRSVPELQKAGEGHVVACHRAGEIEDLPEIPE